MPTIGWLLFIGYFVFRAFHEISRQPRIEGSSLAIAAFVVAIIGLCVWFSYWLRGRLRDRRDNGKNVARARYKFVADSHSVGVPKRAGAPSRGAIRVERDLAEVHHNLGNSLAAQGKFKEAAAEYHAAVQLEPDNTDAHANLGFTLNELGKSDEAIAEFRTAIRLNPDDAVLHYLFGIVLKAQRKPEDAIAEFRTARDNAAPGSDLAQLIEQALTDADH
jgi:Tfp pilus assembly protein PilF